MNHCRYCDNKAIGTEKEYFDNTLWRFPVCMDCAHINATVTLFNGATIQIKTTSMLITAVSK